MVVRVVGRRVKVESPVDTHFKAHGSRRAKVEKEVAGKIGKARDRPMDWMKWQMDMTTGIFRFAAWRKAERSALDVMGEPPR